jgi:hypothetical protein
MSITPRKSLSEQDVATLQASLFVLKQSGWTLLSGVLTLLLGGVLVLSACAKGVFALVCSFVWLFTFLAVSLQYALYLIASRPEMTKGSHQ